MDDSAQKSILVVDDDRALVEALTAVFESAGYAVRTAATAEDALAQARRRPPDLVILDVMLSTGTEGFHLAYEFRRDEALRRVPIVMLTAIHHRAPFRFSPETDGEFLPVDRFLEKPVDPVRLLGEVADLLTQ